jgi:hypothetical protein
MMSGCPPLVLMQTHGAGWSHSYDGGSNREEEGRGLCGLAPNCQDEPSPSPPVDGTLVVPRAGGQGRVLEEASPQLETRVALRCWPSSIPGVHRSWFGRSRLEAG